MTTKLIPLDSIDVDDRLRLVDPVAAEGIAISLVEIGQLQPVEVAEIAGGRYRLVIGGHRVAAARALHWTDILATIFEGPADMARLREIDENLYRRELSPFDQATFLAERRDVCQRLGLLGTKGGARRNQSPRVGLRSFEAELAEKFGIGRSTMFKALQRHGRIQPPVWARLAGSKLAEQGTALDALAAVPGDKQMRVVERWFATAQEDEPVRVSFAALCREAMGGKAEKVPASRKRRLALKAAWFAADHSDVTWLMAEIPLAALYHLSNAVAAEVKRRSGQGELPA